MKHIHGWGSSRTHSPDCRPSAYITTNHDFQPSPTTTTTCLSYKASHNSSSPAEKKSHATCLRKIRAHTHIRGIDLADAATKLAVTDLESLPQAHTMRVELGAIAPRPLLWVMYTSKTPTPPPALATGPRQATLRHPWWTIPKAYQMHAFTHPSHQLRQKVRVATLRNMHYTSLYKRLILRAREQGARIVATGQTLHTRLRKRSKEGTDLLKYLYGQLHNGKLAHRYGHAPTDECPLCYLPDSCTQIAGNCEARKNLHINRHNAAC